MKLLQEAARLFPTYEKMLKEKNRYDFEDMIRWVINAFKKDKNLLLNYQEQYLYYLVDEYQDTNGAQNELLGLLTDYWDVPNVFVVGDDDQSIFRFQGANVKNIMEFYDAHSSHLKQVVLKENYRSTQHILDAAKCLISLNEERLAKIKSIEKDFRASHHEYANLDIKPRIIEYANVAQEETAIAMEIEKLYGSGTDLDEVAVIYSQHKQSENLINIFEKKELPYNTARKLDILKEPFIRNIINVLRYITAEYNSPYSDETRLFEIMHYDFFNIDSRDISQMAAACFKKRSGLRLRDFIGNTAKLKTLPLRSLNAILTFEPNINYWIGAIPNITLQELFEKLITRGGILNYVLQSADRIWLMQMLASLFDFIKTETAKKSSLGLRGLITLIDLMQEEQIELSIEKTMYASKGVHLITAHSSKGREFKYVFLMGCTDKYWDKRSKAGRGNFSYPDTLTPMHSEVDEREEIRRLFYVAMTRAKAYLNISYSAKDNNDKPLEKCAFINEIMDGASLEIEQQIVEDKNMMEYHFHLMQEPEFQPIPLLDKNHIDNILKDYTLSVTHLNNYLTCPLSFYYEKILRIPLAKNEYLAFGDAVHRALKRLFDTMQNSGEKQFPHKEHFINYFLEAIERKRESFTDQQYERRIDYGRQILGGYYDKYVHQWNKIVKSEHMIYNIEMDGVPISGRLDKLEFDGNNVNVVDYKTGKSRERPQKNSPPSDKNSLGGDNWRQIVFYKILMDNDRSKKWSMVSGELDFLEKINEKDDFEKRKYVVTEQEIQIVKDQIKDTYHKIMNHEFNEGCGEEYCRWCDFVKSNNLTI